jgi:cytochrome c556
MSTQSRPDGRPGQGVPELDAALRDVVEDFARHSRKNSEAIDVLVHALKAVHQDLQEEKARSQVLEERVKKTEAALARVSEVMDALRRQGWVQ